VAQRPRLSLAVVEAPRSTGPNRPVLTAPGRNTTADISEPCMARMVEYAKTISTMGGPLVASHPRLNAELVTAPLSVVGQSLRHAIVDRFDRRRGRARTPRSPPRCPTASRGPSAAAPTHRRIKLRGQARRRPASSKARLPGAGAEGTAARPVRGGAAKAGRLPCRGGAPRGDQSRPAEDGWRWRWPRSASNRSVFPTILEMVRQCNDGLPGGGAEAHAAPPAHLVRSRPRSPPARFRQAVSRA